MSQCTRIAFRWTTLISLGATVALGPPSVAAASPPTITVQAQAANAGFLAYAPAPPHAGAMCLVDTGVTPTADTSPTLAYATSLDGGTTNDTDPAGHGTLLAMLAGGQGHGLRGIWPSIKIVSVRASSTPAPGRSPTYQYANYVEALRVCLAHQGLGVKTVNLSLASTIPPTPDQAQTFAQSVDELGARGIAIVGAGGNTPGKVQYPAAEPGVLSVGAGSLPGGTCAFSATEGVGLWAPGCELEFADPFTDEYEPNEFAQGTSDAAVIADASLTALMTYDPSLTVAQAEDLLITTAASGHLNVAGAFEAAGLGDLVAAGNAAIPGEASPQPFVKVPNPTSPSIPRASIRSLSWRSGTLTLKLRALARGDRANIAITTTHHLTRQASSSRPTISLRCSRPRKARVWLSDGKLMGPVSIMEISETHTGSGRTRPHKSKSS
jgi:hypothetical protein